MVKANGRAPGFLGFARNDKARFRHSLLAWYRGHGRDLPWRRTRDPYAILVSELMLQQTQVATVIPYYIEWLRRFPDFASLAAASASDVLHAWEGLGYYGRARNLHATAKAVIAEHGGVLPVDPAVARQLPGLGRYTANAVATFAFNQPVPIVEANTARVLSRLLDIRLPIDTAAGRTAIWSAAAGLVPRKGAGAFNSALMDLGATICIARKPKCEICPVRGHCLAPDPANLPLKKPRPAVKLLTEDHSFTFRDREILLEQSRERWRGMWTLPRLTSPAGTGRPIHIAQFPFTHHRVTLRVFDQRVLRSSAHCWFAIAELGAIPMPSPHRRALNALLVTKQNKDAEREIPNLCSSV